MPSIGRTRTAIVLVVLAGAAGIFGGRWAVEQVAEPACEFTAAGRTQAFSPEQSANAATISALAVRRGLPSRAASIALATAIQESKLRNLTYGDADSQGLFQQRPSQGWGGVDQVTDPVYAAGAFYDALVQVDGWQDGVITEVAQEVQRSAYPDAYADHEWEGRVLASVLTGQTPAGIRCDLAEPETAGDATATADKVAEQLGLDAQVGEGQLVVTTAGDSRAWAVASWAVAHAEAEQVVRVEVDGQVWDRGGEPGWTAAAAPATDARTVQVILAP